MRSQEKMIGSYTSGIIAFMADVQIIGDRTEMKLPRNAVGVIPFPVFINRASVAVRTENYGVPAVICFVDVAPKPFFNSTVAFQDTTSVATTETTANSAFGRFNCELFTAVVATHGKHRLSFLHNQSVTQGSGCRQDLLIGETLTA